MPPLDAELRRSEGDVERLVLAMALVFVVLLLLAMASDESGERRGGSGLGEGARRCEMAKGGWCCSSRAVILREGE